MEKAMALTEGKGFQFLFETVGQVSTIKMAYELAGSKVRLCLIGTSNEPLMFTPQLREKLL